ncbi:MAG TPA: polysaccharide biosynthesis/export family protein [Pyrinomonadaceae bacterium]
MPVTGSRNLATSAVSDDARYRIGPGDVLDIRVLKAPELSREAVRVDQRGMIHMPMITEEITAACLTEAELQQKIATRYLEYKRNPVVDVFIKEYQSQPVSIVGALNNMHPEGSQFRLHRQVRLLELIALSGGLSERAGQTVNIVHTTGADLCSKSPVAPGNDSELGALVSYRLSDTMHGLPEANPILRAGDIVVVPEGAQAYVVGNVLKPSTIPLREPTTVSRAIAMAGGTGMSSRKERVRIVRQIPGSQIKQEIYVDLTAVEKRKAEDIILLPNDIVDVPTSGTKSFLRSLMGAVAPAMSQVPARIIP